MNEILWLIGGLSLFFTIIGGLMMASDDQEAKTAGYKVMVGWWASLASVIGFTLAMTFVIKPVINWLLTSL